MDAAKGDAAAGACRGEGLCPAARADRCCGSVVLPRHRCEPRGAPGAAGGFHPSPIFTAEVVGAAVPRVVLPCAGEVLLSVLLPSPSQCCFSCSPPK